MVVPDRRIRPRARAGAGETARSPELAVPVGRDWRPSSRARPAGQLADLFRRGGGRRTHGVFDGRVRDLSDVLFPPAGGSLGGSWSSPVFPPPPHHLGLFHP